MLKGMKVKPGTNRKNPPWLTTEWKEKRVHIIKDKCEQCGTDKPPMVLQHTLQPTPAIFLRLFIKRQVMREKISQGLELSENKILELQKPHLLTTCCPNCGFKSVSVRKHMLPKFRCSKCTHEFDKPGNRPNWMLSECKRAKYNYRSSLYKKYADEINSKISEQQDAEQKRYMSMVDTITLCKGCAYLWDIHGRKKCDKCGAKWHNTSYNVCFTCHEDTDLLQSWQ